SSSALLMGSLDVARRALATGEDAIGASIDTAIRFRELLETDERFADIGEGFAAFPDIAETDLLRVPIDVSATGISAHWIRDRLMTEHDLYFEMSTDTTLVAVIGAGKTPDVDSVFATLIGVIESDEGQAQSSTGRAQADFPELPAPGPVRVRPREGYFAATEIVPAAEAVGRISADSLAAYPPGVPNVMPGEEITAEAVDFLTAVAASPSGSVRGAVTSSVDSYRVPKGWDPAGPAGRLRHRVSVRFEIRGPSGEDREPEHEEDDEMGDAVDGGDALSDERRDRDQHDDGEQQQVDR